MEKKKVKKVSFNEYQASHEENGEEEEDEESHRDERRSNGAKNTMSFHHESLECKSSSRNEEEKEMSENTFEEEAHSLLNIHLVSTLTNSPSEQSIGISGHAKNFFFEQTEQQIDNFKVGLFY